MIRIRLRAILRGAGWARALGVILAASLLAACSSPGSTPKPTPANAAFCAAVSALNRSLDDLNKLNASTATVGEIRTAIAAVSSDFARVVQAGRGLGQVQMDKLQATVGQLRSQEQAMPSAATAQQTLDGLREQIGAVTDAAKSIGSEVGC